MTKSLAALAITTLLTLPLLGGCNKTAVDPAAPQAPTAPTAPGTPDKPTAPDAVVPAAPHDKPSAGASASVNANGVEARAGDVSVKLPD